MDPTKKKQLETFLYSTIGIAAVALIVIALNLIAARVRQRIDLTAEKAYTLSPGTRAILAKVDTPIQIRFYWTKNPSTMPVFLSTYAHADDVAPNTDRPQKGGSKSTAESRARFGCEDSAVGRSKRNKSAPEKEYIRLMCHARPETGDPIPDAGP
jgi:hypothetical protein